MEVYRQFEILGKENECIEKEQAKIRVALNDYENKKNENVNVKKELELLEEDDKVYKLIGPTLIEQDISEAKTNVDSRIELINKEISKLDKNYKENNKKIENNKNKLLDIQAKLIQVAKQLEAKKNEGK